MHGGQFARLSLEHSIAKRVTDGKDLDTASCMSARIFSVDTSPRRAKYSFGVIGEKGNG